MERLDVKQKLWSLLDDTKDELLSLCSDLIRRPNLNPPIDPGEITGYIKDYFTKWNVPFEVVGARPDRPIIIAKVGKGGGFTLCFNGHSDVVNPGVLDKWNFAPHCGDITDTQILGRGSSDMLCGVAMDMHIMRLIVERGVEINGTIVMHIVADEESGGELGSKWLVENGYCDDINALILGEPTSWTNIETGSKGGLWATIRAYGTQAHGSIASFISENAIAKMSGFLGRMDELRKIPAHLKESQMEVIANSKREAVNTFGVEEVGDAIDHITYNISTMKSGAPGKAECEYCEAGIHFRIPNGISSDVLKAGFLAIAEESGVDVEIHNIKEAEYTPVDAPLVQSAVKNSTYIWGKTVYPVYQWASSDGLYYRSIGIPAIQNGPCNPGIHGYNETADILEIMNIAKNHMAIAVDLLDIKY